MPAHFCGVTGFKPTNGRVSRANAMPLSFTLDTVGPLAQTAEDCAIDPVDHRRPRSARSDHRDARRNGTPQATKRPAKGLTIGIPKSFYVDDLEPDVAKALDDAIAVFKKLGVQDRAGRSAGPGRWSRRPR